MSDRPTKSPPSSRHPVAFRTAIGKIAIVQQPTLDQQLYIARMRDAQHHREVLAERRDRARQREEAREVDGLLAGLALETEAPVMKSAAYWGDRNDDSEHYAPAGHAAPRSRVSQTQSDTATDAASLDALLSEYLVPKT